MMHKIVVMVFSVFCLWAFTPTLSLANNGPKIKLVKKNSKSSKSKTALKKQNNTTRLSKTNPKLSALTKELPAKPSEKLYLKKDIEQKEALVAKLNIDAYHEMEHKSLINATTLLQEKYAGKMQVAANDLVNFTLLKEIDFWYGTPYRFGGSSKKGIDCSSFSQALMSEVYDIDLPRTAREQFAIISKTTKDDLEQGDLVFFNTRGGISHVGVYLGNNKFVHSSTSVGVTISDLDERYWASRYRGAGKVK